MQVGQRELNLQQTLRELSDTKQKSMLSCLKSPYYPFSHSRYITKLPLKIEKMTINFGLKGMWILNVNP